MRVQVQQKRKINYLSKNGNLDRINNDLINIAHKVNILWQL